MAKKHKSGLKGIDRQIQSKRKAISAINKKKSEKKKLVKKKSTLNKLENQLKTLRKSLRKK